MQKKLVLLFAGIVLAFALLVGRITYINAFNGDKYSKIVLDQQQYQSRTIPFKRGDIVDRNGTKLATSQRVYNVILDAKVMNSDEKYIDPTIQVLADCFGLDKSDVEDQVEENPNSRYLIMRKGVSYEKAQEFEKIDEDDENYPNVNGIWLEEDYVRTYPYNTLASDVIGFTVSGNVGSNGIEASYNSILNGTDGREYGYLSEDSSYEKTVREAQNGDTVVSTIDLQVQSVVEKYITQFNEENRSGTTLGSKNTAVMVMNPQNGEILAEASYPNYDLNNPRDLTKLHTEEELAALSDEEKVKELNSLWNNFCISSGYEPGSTFKPFTISEGLDLGVLTGDESYVCNGVLHVGDHDIHCSNRDGHGTQSLKVALENSCNVALMQIGSAIGKEQFVRYQQLFGFGQSTGIDLPGEAAGLLYSLEDMDSSTLATNAFGQNFNVTMTQLAASFCSLINGGNYYEPHVVKQIQDENGNVIDGDLILYVCGKYLKEIGQLKDDMIVTTVMSNIGLYKACDKVGLHYQQTKVGDKYVFENMMENGYRLGGEQSGHIIFSKHATTGDGILTSLKIMEVLLEKKTTLGTLASEVKIYPQLLENLRVTDKKAVLEHPAVKEVIEQVKEDLGSDGRILVRESGTEPLLRVMVEATTQELCKEYVGKVIETMKSIM